MDPCSMASKGIAETGIVTSDRAAARSLQRRRLIRRREAIATAMQDAVPASAPRAIGGKSYEAITVSQGVSEKLD